MTQPGGQLWWSNMELMQLAPSGGQIWNQYASGASGGKLATNASGAIWWTNLQPIQEVSLKSISNYSS